MPVRTLSLPEMSSHSSLDALKGRTDIEVQTSLEAHLSESPYCHTSVLLQPKHQNVRSSIYSPLRAGCQFFIPPHVFFYPFASILSNQDEKSPGAVETPGHLLAAPAIIQSPFLLTARASHAPSPPGSPPCRNANTNRVHRRSDPDHNREKVEVV